MITINTDQAQPFLSQPNLTAATERAAAAFEEVKNGQGKGNEWLGWRRILANPDDELTGRLFSAGRRINREADVLIVCGIGGSYLGAKAVIDALRPPFDTDGPEIIFTGHHIGGQYLEKLLEYLDVPNADGSGKSVFVNVISKSGSTLETALSFRIISGWMSSVYGDKASSRIIATTGPQGGVLNKIIVEKGYEKFVIPEDVGGRFSVLTPVGLLPIAAAGIDIEKLFYGAKGQYTRYEKSADDLLQYAAVRYLFHEEGKSIDVISSFHPELHAMAGWTQQLLGESEGKGGKGIFPVPAAYSTDLHSIGQMVQQGRRNLMETFLVVDQAITDFAVPKKEKQNDGLGYLSGKSFHEINRHALEGTIEAHTGGGVPVVTITLDRLDETTIGELIYQYELFTAIYVYLLDENPFDQPGVEDYKKAMYRKLGKT